jgi:hypothetical protein
MLHLVPNAFSDVLAFSSLRPSSLQSSPLLGPSQLTALCTSSFVCNCVPSASRTFIRQEMLHAHHRRYSSYIVDAELPDGETEFDSIFRTPN